MQTQFDDESLVAYLDGELPAEQAAAISSAADSDAELQQRLASLRTTWELLGELPDEPLDRRLAESTIEMVSLQIERESQSWLSWILRHWWLAFALLTATSFVAGAVVSNIIHRRTERQALEDLHLLANYHALARLPNPEFLEMLEKVDNLAASVSPEELEKFLVPADVEQRRLWLDELDGSQKSQLEENFRRLNELPPTRNKNSIGYREMSKLGQRLTEDKDPSQRTVRALQAYDRMIRNAGARDLHEELSGDQLSEEKKIAKINSELAFQYQLGTTDRNVIDEWVSEAIYGYSDDGMPLAYSLSIADVLLSFYQDNGDSPDALIQTRDIDELTERLAGSPAQNLLAALHGDERREIVAYWVSDVNGPDETATLSTGDLIQRYNTIRSGETKRLVEILPESVARRHVAEQ